MMANPMKDQFESEKYKSRQLEKNEQLGETELRRLFSRGFYYTTFVTLVLPSSYPRLGLTHYSLHQLSQSNSSQSSLFEKRSQSLFERRSEKQHITSSTSFSAHSVRKVAAAVLVLSIPFARIISCCHHLRSKEARNQRRVIIISKTSLLRTGNPISVVCSTCIISINLLLPLQFIIIVEDLQTSVPE